MLLTSKKLVLLAILSLLTAILEEGVFCILFFTAFYGMSLALKYDLE